MRIQSAACCTTSSCQRKHRRLTNNQRFEAKHKARGTDFCSSHPSRMLQGELELVLKRPYKTIMNQGVCDINQPSNDSIYWTTKLLYEGIPHEHYNANDGRNDSKSITARYRYRARHRLNIQQTLILPLNVTNGLYPSLSIFRNELVLPGAGIMQVANSCNRQPGSQKIHEKRI